MPGPTLGGCRPPPWHAWQRSRTGCGRGRDSGGASNGSSGWALVGEGPVPVRRLRRRGVRERPQLVEIGQRRRTAARQVQENEEGRPAPGETDVGGGGGPQVLAEQHPGAVRREQVRRQERLT